MKYKVNETWQLLLKKRFRRNCLQVQKMPRTDAHLALLLRSKCEMSF